MTLAVARRTSEVSHNHPEGIKGAEATACAIFLAHNGSVKAEIKVYIEETSATISAAAAMRSVPAITSGNLSENGS